MMLRIKAPLLTVIAAASLLSLPASAAKFAANVVDAQLLHSGTAVAGATPESTAVGEILKASLHTANKKDLLMGVSLQIGLYTDTQVKGKNGSTETAGAEGGVMVAVLVDGVPAMPGQVVFSKRFQELSATLGGVIESCSDGDLDGDIVIEDDCEVTDEMIRLVLDTTAAHHFNFVLPDMEAGDHEVVVTATAMSSAQVENGIEGEATNSASGYAVVGKGSLTVQEVQAVNTKDPYSEGGTVLNL